MKPDIYVAIPTVRDWKPEFGVSMVGLTFRLGQLAREGKIRGFYVNNKITSNLPKGRQAMLDDAMGGEFTHILWIDDDTQFPLDAVETMLARDKDWVTANICKKDGSGWIAAYDGGEKVNSSGKVGVEKIGTMGLGMALIRLDAIRQTKAPHFEMVWVDERRGYLGEDLYFLLKCRQETGIDIWVDHDVSNKVRHIGNHGYGAQDFTDQKMENAV